LTGTISEDRAERRRGGQALSRRTIRQSFSAFLFRMIAFMLILLAGSLVLSRLSAQMSEKERLRLTRLDEGFDALEDSCSHLHDRLFRTAEYDSAPLERAGLSLTALAEEPGTDIFVRDTKDVCTLFQRYSAQAEALEETLGAGAAYDDSYALYLEAEQTYGWMTEYRDVLYSEILTYQDQVSARRQRYRIVLWLLFGLLAACLAAGMYLDTRKLTREIVQPVQELSETMRKIDYADMESALLPAQVHSSQGEIRNMLDTYNGMIARLMAQSREHDELQEARLKLQKLQLTNLQQQINPHFLFNTLNMISQTAFLEDADQTEELLKTVSRLLRYSLDYTDRSVKLGRELQALNDYVSIQERRFGDRIRFVFHLDESVNDCVVLSNILQPVAENCIAHGLAMKDAGGLVEIETGMYAEDGQNFVCITIADNGSGMPEKTLQTLRERLQEQDMKNEHIGLVNVAQRLRLFYKGGARIQILSRPDEGTKVTLLLPMSGRE